MLVHTALESAEANLSDAVSTTAWEAHTGYWAFKSELESAGLSGRPLRGPLISHAVYTALCVVAYLKTCIENRYDSANR